MKRRAASQSEFKIADAPGDLRHLPLDKVRALRDAAERELVAKLADKVGPKLAAAALDEICRCTASASAYYADLLEASTPPMRKRLRTLRTLAQFAASLERRACQRHKPQAA